jgi:hypothetical protein
MGQATAAPTPRAARAHPQTRPGHGHNFLRFLMGFVPARNSGRS